MDEFIANYNIVKTIGKGGMGEVFLAYDPFCQRNIAIKKMLCQWEENPVMRERFLREARIAAQLSHPSIIPIYSIDEKGNYYTMPFIDGETLRSVLRTTKRQAKTGEALHPIGSSVPALIRIFLSVCEAIAFAHVHQVLHRDLKPENIMIGKFGEVIILDWGLADFIDHADFYVEEEPVNHHLTKPGKIPGTLLYMAPERAFGARSSILTDIYSLGVILYQLLTLQFPFRRTSLKEFKKMFKFEQILDPEEIAPDRDIPPYLSSIVQKCLSVNPEERFHNVKELIHDVQRYISGVPEWIETARLDIRNKKDWEFQENVVLAKHIAITRDVDLLEWVNLMLSKSSYPGNFKIEIELILKEGNKGIGLLFCQSLKKMLSNKEEGYCLWLGGSSQGIRLFHSQVEVLQYPHILLYCDRPYVIGIEKIDHHVHFFLDQTLIFSFLSHIPVSGDRIGLLLRDEKFSLSPLRISMGSQNMTINCLAVPDAFLKRQHFDEALAEYRKIAQSFPGRAEGREAIFRAGITLLKKAQYQTTKRKQKAFFTLALDEFEKLHATPGAPLEYLGKARVYEETKELDEEIKCLELALRKFPKHPLKPILIENVISRLHESAQEDRYAAYQFALLALQHLSHYPDTISILELLQKHLEPLPFFFPYEKKEIQVTLELAFWLKKPMVIVEMLEKGLEPLAEKNAQIALILLGHEKLSDSLKEEFLAQLSSPEMVSFMFYYGVLYKKASFSLFKHISLTSQKNTKISSYILWKEMLENNWKETSSLIKGLKQKLLHDEMNPLFFLHGCFLAKTKGKLAAEKILTSITEKNYPPLSLLLSHFLLGRIDLSEWLKKAFFWEKITLLLQLSLYFQCLKKTKQKNVIEKILKKVL